MGKFKKDSSDTKISPASNPDIAQIRQALSERRRLPIVLASDSMSPLLPTGAHAEIEACTLDQLKFLDLVLFSQNSLLICHCYFGQNEFRSPSGERTLITRGLASKYFDNVVAESQLVGRVTTHKLSQFSYFFFRLCNKLIGRSLTRKIFYREL